MAANYIEIMNFRGPQGFMAAIAEAAARESIKPSEFARRAVLERIARNGVTPPALQPPKTQEG
ncbi:hypothetical protein [Xanthobacter flavus]|uniref:hypothetical protein n=1 Tax=Xanthobacter flavus TaxID=281 RepID=UPI00372C4097